MTQGKRANRPRRSPMRGKVLNAMRRAWVLDGKTAAGALADWRPAC